MVNNTSNNERLDEALKHYSDHIESLQKNVEEITSLYPNEASNPVYQNEVASPYMETNAGIATDINEDGQYEIKDSYHFSTIKPIHIKHISHLDLDGYGSTILSEILQSFVPEGYYNLETNNILPNRLNTMMKEVIDNLDDYDRVVITDLAINDDLLEMIKNCKNPEKIRVFDHHKCDLNDLPDNVIITKDSPLHPGKLTCATELYFNYILHDPIFDLIKIRGNDNAIAYFVECIRVYDTFEFWKTRNDPENTQYETYVDAPRLNTLFHILEREDFKQYIYHFLLNDHHTLTHSNSKYPYISEVLALEANKNTRYVDAALRRLIKTDLCCTVWRDSLPHKLNYHIGVIFAEKNGPVIGNTACEQNPELDFCAVVSNNQISLYTNKENIDVSSIAKLFGGGGHEEAAGLTIPYINANVYSLNHFFNIIECAGRLTPGQFDSQSYDMSDTN